MAATDETQRNTSPNRIESIIDGLGLDHLRKKWNDSTMNIRPARISDAYALAAIFNEPSKGPVHSLLASEMTEEDARDLVIRYRNEGFALWVLETCTGIGAWVSIKPFSWCPITSRRTCESALYIAERLRKKGLATHLCWLLYKIASSMNYEIVTALILQHNRASRQLFASMGGKFWGIFPGVLNINKSHHSLVIYGIEFDDIAHNRFERLSLRWQAAVQRMRFCSDSGFSKY